MKNKFLLIFLITLCFNCQIFGIGSVDIGMTDKSMAHILCGATTSLWLEKQLGFSEFQSWLIMTSVIVSKEIIDLKQGHNNGAFNYLDFLQWQAGYFFTHIRFYF